MEISVLIESGQNSFWLDVMKSNEQNRWRLFVAETLIYTEKSYWVYKVGKNPTSKVGSKAYGNLSVFTGFSIILHRKRKKQPSSGTSTYCCCISYMVKIKHAWAWGRGKSVQTVCDNLVTGVQSMTIHPDLLQLMHNSSIIPISWLAFCLHCCKFGLFTGNSRWFWKVMFSLVTWKK